MTREEQIQQAEINYSVDTIFDGCDYIGQVAKQEAFIAGAKWADKHPDKRNVYTKDELYKMGFAFDTNGNIADPKRDPEMWDRYVEYKQGKWFDKVCKYITPILKTYCSEECIKELIEGLKNKLEGDL